MSRNISESLELGHNVMKEISKVCGTYEGEECMQDFGGETSEKETT
jgi:hypothetical protein